MTEEPEHHVVAWPYLLPGVGGITLPVPFALPVILVRRRLWETDNGFRAHELVHVAQIAEMGTGRYLMAHGMARVRSVAKWATVGLVQAFLAKGEPIEQVAYERQREVADG